VRQTLSKRPVIGALKAFRGISSHDRGPFARVVRAGVRVGRAARLAFSSKQTNVSPLGSA
jgi:hypothetical protein